MLNDKLGGRRFQTTAPKGKGPVWAGPEKGGITFSLLSRFLNCRHRFGLLVIDGLKPADKFNHKIEYGSMWHACEEALAKDSGKYLKECWETSLSDYTAKLYKKYPFDQELIRHWHGVCSIQFPLYVEHWEKQPDVLHRIPLEQEVSFNVPYQLPSGRRVNLRGKRDATDLIGKPGGVYLQENKTKSRIDETKMRRQLTFDLQTMMYLTALYNQPSCDLHRQGYYRYGGGLKLKAGEYPICGVRYNVVRRTEHRQGKKETPDGFLERLKGIIEEDPNDWFMRWKIEVSMADIKAFQHTCLDPILENLCDWWEMSTLGPDNAFKLQMDRYQYKKSFVTPTLWRHPFGVYNSLDEGNASDLDEYLYSGSQVGLQRITKNEDLFPELQEAV